jgi:hypothetical protein
MRVLLILAAIAFRQPLSLKVHRQDRRQTAGAGKTQGTDGMQSRRKVSGTKLWADVWSELRGSISVTETQSLSERATAVVSPVRTSDCLDQRRPPDLLT